MTPNVVLVGVAKCGTTSLFSHLYNHPQVVTTHLDESHYLMDRGHPLFDGEVNYYKNGLGGFDQLFSGTKCGKRVFLDYTPDYFYQETALDVLSSMTPAPKILFILRNPSDRAYSLYTFALNVVGCLGKNITFQEMLHMVEKDTDKVFAERPILKNILEHGKYINYIRKWEDKIPTGVRVYYFEDLVKNPCEIMQHISDELGIDASFYDDFDFTHKNKTEKSKYESLVKAKGIFKKLLPSNSWGYQTMKGVYQAINRSPIRKSKQDLESIRMLDGYFEEYNRMLEDHVGNVPWLNK